MRAAIGSGLVLALTLLACNSDSSGGATAAGAPAAPVKSICAADTAAPVVHDHERIVADATWAAGTHVVRGMVAVQKGATLTIAPCAVVEMEADAQLLVAGPTGPDTATLVADGAADQPITIVSADPSTSWADIEVRQGGAMRLAYVTVEGGGGGNGPFTDATIRVSGDQYAPPQEMLSTKHVTLKGSNNFGVYLDGHGTFTADSDDLTITGAKKYPIALAASSLANLPLGAYTGNGVDQIAIRGAAGYETIASDVTMRNLGVPYRVGIGQSGAPEILVSTGKAGTLATLTIDPGVHVLFEKNGWLEIEHYTGDQPATGALVARGTADEPIVFSSAAPAPAAGDWVGLWFSEKPSPKNAVDHVRVEYAGGATGTENFSCNDPFRDEAAILILGEPAGQFVTNTTIVASARYGIDRGWDGGDIDFLASNTFEAVASCKQSQPHASNHSCPQAPACP